MSGYLSKTNAAEQSNASGLRLRYRFSFIDAHSNGSTSPRGAMSDPGFEASCERDMFEEDARMYVENLPNQVPSWESEHVKPCMPVVGITRVSSNMCDTILAWRQSCTTKIQATTNQQSEVQEQLPVSIPALVSRTQPALEEPCHDLKPCIEVDCRKNVIDDSTCASGSDCDAQSGIGEASELCIPDAILCDKPFSAALGCTPVKSAVATWMQGSLHPQEVNTIAAPPKQCSTTLCSVTAQRAAAPWKPSLKSSGAYCARVAASDSDAQISDAQSGIGISSDATQIASIPIDVSGISTNLCHGDTNPCRAPSLSAAAPWKPTLRHMSKVVGGVGSVSVSSEPRRERDLLHCAPWRTGGSTSTATCILSDTSMAVQSHAAEVQPDTLKPSSDSMLQQRLQSQSESAATVLHIRVAAAIAKSDAAADAADEAAAHVAQAVIAHSAAATFAKDAAAAARVSYEY